MLVCRPSARNAEDVDTIFTKLKVKVVQCMRAASSNVSFAVTKTVWKLPRRGVAGTESLCGVYLLSGESDA